MPGDAADFREFITTNSRDLLRTGWLLTGDWALAEDLVQITLLRCWPHWSSIATPDAYVRSALVKTFVSTRRRRWAGEQPAAALADVPAPDAFGPADVRASVRSALAALPARERAVVVLRYYADLSEADTAAALGIAPGTVKRYASDALAKLRADPALDGLLTEEVLP
jgi:RNA polymerase sigma-70 factor (sigma-E family)